MSIYLPTYCPGTKCDPCKQCHWIPGAYGIPPSYKIIDPGHADDGAIDQARVFCGAPFFGMGLTSESPLAAPGSIVNGSVRMDIGGVWSAFGLNTDTFGGTVPYPSSPPQFPPAVPVMYAGVPVFLIDPSAGVITNYSHGAYTNEGTFIVVGGSPYPVGPFYTTMGWIASSKIIFPNCIMLDPAKDKIVAPYNCVLPYTGPLPLIAMTINPTRASSGASSGYPPGTLLTLDSVGTPIYNWVKGSFTTFPDTNEFQVYLYANKLIDP
jgi:hypothetical protein